jgi:hypothetical protein
MPPLRSDRRRVDVLVEAAGAVEAGGGVVSKGEATFSLDATGLSAASPDGRRRCANERDQEYNFL